MAKKRRRSKTWRHSVGDRGVTVTVEERSPKDDMLQIRYWDPRAKKYVRKSLGHRDRDEAKAKAAQVYADLLNQDDDPLAEDITLARLFAAYKARKTRLKANRSQPEDARRIEMWVRVLKGHIDPHTITPDDMEQFQHLRKRGAIDARGNRVEKNAKPVRQRAVELDIVWLKGVLTWGTKNRDREGQFYLRLNPIADFTPKKEKNPRRPVATQDRYEALLKKADLVEMEVRWNGKREKRRSYFRELLVLCHETGRRISQVCRLRFEDLRLEKTKEAPYGGIVWPEDSDKTGTEYIAPMSPVARGAIDAILRDRPGIGKAFLFPKPTDPNKPITKDYARDLLEQAEKLAELRHLPHGGYHAYRRKWGTERKHLPDADVMAAGGWSDIRSLKEAYQHADPQTTLNVVLNRKELREVK